MNDFNKELCEERHKKIVKEFQIVWDAIKNNDKKLDRIMNVLLVNVGLAIAIGLMLLYFRGL